LVGDIDHMALAWGRRREGVWSLLECPRGMCGDNGGLHLHTVRKLSRHFAFFLKLRKPSQKLGIIDPYH
jgi:hypothetical protein